jgi:hypothetical protein
MLKRNSPTKRNSDFTYNHNIKNKDMSNIEKTLAEELLETTVKGVFKQI